MRNWLTPALPICSKWLFDPIWLWFPWSPIPYPWIWTCPEICGKSFSTFSGGPHLATPGRNAGVVWTSVRGLDWVVKWFANIAPIYLLKYVLNYCGIPVYPAAGYNFGPKYPVRPGTNRTTKLVGPRIRARAQCPKSGAGRIKGR